MAPPYEDHCIDQHIHLDHDNNDEYDDNNDNNEVGDDVNDNKNVEFDNEIVIAMITMH